MYHIAVILLCNTTLSSDNTISNYIDAFRMLTCSIILYLSCTLCI